ncbi:UvrB/UvrC motif-containing protein [Sphingobacterium sp. T2]
MEQLESTLQKAIANEQYEVAAKIRDEIEKRKSSL